MKKRYSIIFLLALSLSTTPFAFSNNAALLAQEQIIANTERSDFLKAMEDLNSKGYKITNIQKLQIGDKMKNPFKEKYAINFEQPIDHNHPDMGAFNQRVIIGFAGWDRPTEIVTEGYGAAYAYNPNYRDEPSKLLDANMIFVEHRYFLSSTPFRQQDTSITDEALNWDYMNAKQAAADLHNIAEAFKNILKTKWIASGISKGGQTAMFYTTYYPNDMDITIPYVGPLCKGVEDGRHEPFIADFCGTPEQRAKILAYQRELLKRRSTIEPMLADYIKANGLKYTISLQELLDFCVMEFSFAFWQWGSDIAMIPNLETATDNELFYVLLKVSGPDYFSEGKDSSPFYVQAARELGYYGYDTKPFKDLLTVKSSKCYLKRIFLPYANDIKFNKELYNDVSRFLKTTDSKMMFIYGEFDPWSSVMPVEPVKNEKLKKKGKGKSNMVLFIDPKGSHRARISTLPEPIRQQAITILKDWLAE